MRSVFDRRTFLASGGAAILACTIPVTQVKLAFARSSEIFTFAIVSDAHIEQIHGAQFVRNWDRGLLRAVAETNLLSPAPDFVVFGGDLAQHGTRAELEHGAEILSALHAPARYVIGEHDYYLDMGESWSKLFGPLWYSFDHKGVHFVVLNSILTHDVAILSRGVTGEERIRQIGSIENSGRSPFMVGDQQRLWLADDLKRIAKSTPIVVLSHAPLQKLYKPWNFWTEDADEVHALLMPFDRVTVIYGHVHQLQYGQVGNISFHSVMATAWPYPYPRSYTPSESYLPKLTVPMNRADPFFERDGTGWQFVSLDSGRAEIYYNLYNNTARTVVFNSLRGRPEDADYQSSDAVTPPQLHY